MKTLKLEDLAIVSGGNDEPTSFFARNDGEVITEVEEIVAEARDEVTVVVGFGLTKLSFGCC